MESGPSELALVVDLDLFVPKGSKPADISKETINKIALFVKQIADFAGLVVSRIMALIILFQSPAADNIHCISRSGLPVLRAAWPRRSEVESGR